MVSLWSNLNIENKLIFFDTLALTRALLLIEVTHRFKPPRENCRGKVCINRLAKNAGMSSAESVEARQRASDYIACRKTQEPPVSTQTSVHIRKAEYLIGKEPTTPLRLLPDDRALIGRDILYCCTLSISVVL